MTVFDAMLEFIGGLVVALVFTFLVLHLGIKTYTYIKSHKITISYVDPGEEYENITISKSMMLGVFIASFVIGIILRWTL